MWPFSGCGKSDACAAPPRPITFTTILALVPFVAVFAVASTLAVRHIYPRLSTTHNDRDGEDHVLPSHAPAALRQVHAEHGAKSMQRRAAMMTFGATVGFATTLAALILAEILEIVDTRAGELTHEVTVPTLLFLLVILVPWLECRSLVSATGQSFQRSAKGKLPRGAWGLQLMLFGGWLFVFWSLGSVVPNAPSGGKAKARDAELDTYRERITRACLERIGVVGISLMALLAGFASVSSPWHTFSDAAARRKRPITDGDVNRRQASLEAANDMLLTKRHMLQLLEQKASEPSQGGAKSGFVGKMMGSIRGASGDAAEMRSLRIEIAALETMENNLSSNLSALKDQRIAAVRASTPMGRLFLIPSYVFSFYCVYRILATGLTTLQRTLSPSSSSFSSTDPINRFLGVLAKHWDPKLDQIAWARTISFLLSGVMLLLSANSVVQTLHLFSRWTPQFLHRHAQASLALAAGQVAATYVISSALLLRSHLPGQVSSVVGGALARGGPLMSPSFADSWFEGWFLVGGMITATAIWIGRSVSGASDGDLGDDYGMDEMGAKRA
ncbi:unnamed protein product [Clonostachys rosea]|uniref:Abscisic acid G-protein coupled receptor-like domain-containing protein n=1 Tax=Bionectria ochroleuca TaxID=29856 RepID=A0ABY6TSI3_BIOOC|nr:unnamed protein product [Clonostachys rosea]